MSRSISRYFAPLAGMLLASNSPVSFIHLVCTDLTDAIVLQVDEVH